MSDTIELTDKILKKLREENAQKPTDIPNKTKTRAKLKAKAEESEVKKTVRRRKKTDD